MGCGASVPAGFTKGEWVEHTDERGDVEWFKFEKLKFEGKYAEGPGSGGAWKSAELSACSPEVKEPLGMQVVKANFEVEFNWAGRGEWYAGTLMSKSTEYADKQAYYVKFVDASGASRKETFPLDGHVRPRTDACHDQAPDTKADDDAHRKKMGEQIAKARDATYPLSCRHCGQDNKSKQEKTCAFCGKDFYG